MELRQGRVIIISPEQLYFTQIDSCSHWAKWNVDASVKVILGAIWVVGSLGSNEKCDR